MKRDGRLADNQEVDLQADLLPFMTAFNELDSERQIGQVVGRIPWSKIVQYANFHDYDVEEMLFFVQALDANYIEQNSVGGTSGESKGSVQMVQRPPRPD